MADLPSAAVVRRSIASIWKGAGSETGRSGQAFCPAGWHGVLDPAAGPDQKGSLQMAFVIHLAHALFPDDAPGFFAGLRRAVAAQRRYVAVTHELDGFSDRDLADLGISRHAIRDIALQDSLSRH